MEDNKEAQVQEQAWAQAKVAVRHLGDLSTTFTSCIRALLANESENQRTGAKGINLVTTGVVKRLLNSPTVVSHLYYAALTYHGEEVKARGKIKPIDLLGIFDLRELAAILTIIYFYRRIVKRSPSGDWDSTAAVLQQYVDIALPLGAAIPAIGPVRSLLVAASRYLAWGSIIAKDPKGFKKYKVAIKLSKKAFDLDLEMSTWGTTYIHIASTMFQSFGFGVEFSSAFFRGSLHSKPEELSDEERKFRVAQIWLDSLVREGDVPKDTLGDEYLLSDSQVESFIDRVGILAEKGSEYQWLLKTRKDLGPDRTPNLMFDFAKANTLSPAGSSSEDEELDTEMGETSPVA